MKLYFYSLKELINTPRLSLLFVLNLCLGLTGFVALDGFKTSLNQTVQGRSKAILGADLAVRVRRPFSEDEVKTVEADMPEFEVSEQVELFSMVANSQKKSRLVQLKVVEENFPFYGDILLDESQPLTEKERQKLKEKKQIWIYPEILRQLSVQKGDRLSIGEAQFKVAAVVEEDAAASFSTSMAPRLYMNMDHLSETGLIRKGSVAWHSRLYKFTNLSEEELNILRDKIYESLDSPDIRVFTHSNNSEQISQMMTRLNDFLGLASLVSLFLAAVGATFLFRSWFQERIQSVAILRSLGASQRQAFTYYFLQVLLLGVVASLLSLVLASLLVPGLVWVTKDLLPFSVQVRLNPQTMFWGVLLGTGASVALCLPVLSGIGRMKLSILLSPPDQTQSRLSLVQWLSFLPGLLLFCYLAVWLSHSYLIGGLFLGLFAGATLFLFALSFILFRGLSHFVKTKSLALRFALRDLSRHSVTTAVIFITMGLGSLLLNIIPQVQKSLSTELQRPEQSKLPSLFMFDIQEEQLGALNGILRDEDVTVDQLSPTIRARLLTVNGEDFDKGKGSSETFSREEEREMRFRNRGFNLSYRDQLSESESLVSGRDFSGPFDEEKNPWAEISVEKRFAERLGLKVGDRLVFDVESVPVKGEIINLRQVRWTSFQPNFFVQFQPGVLDMAPKTYIATLPNMALNEKQNIQDRLVEEIPNVSMVDVSRVVARISEIMDQMAWALLFMSVLCLVAGFVVIYSIASYQVSRRKWEIGLLKSLGASFATVQMQFLLQFTLVSFFAVTFGALLSLLFSFVLSQFLFDSLWVFAWRLPLMAIVVATAFTVFVTWLALRRDLRTKPYQLFMSE